MFRTFMKDVLKVCKGPVLKPPIRCRKEVQSSFFQKEKKTPDSSTEDSQVHDLKTIKTVYHMLASVKNDEATLIANVTKNSDKVFILKALALSRPDNYMLNTRTEDEQ